MNKRKVCLLFLHVLFSHALFADDPTPTPLPKVGYSPRASLFLETPVNSVGWSSNNSFFAVTDSKALYIAEPDKLAPKKINSHDGHIRFMKFAKNPITEKDQLFILTEENNISIRSFPLKTNYPTKKYGDRQVISSVDYASNGNYAALGMENGEIHLLLQLYNTDKLYSQILRGHTKEVNSVAFNPTSELMVSSSRDGGVFIWSLKDNALLYQLTGNRYSKVPVIFSRDSKYIISAKTAHEIIFRNFTGVVVKSIRTKKAIKTMALSKNGRILYVLSTNGIIYLYDILQEIEIGYIPKIASSEILCFAFNDSGDQVLIGCKDGTVYLHKLNDVLYAPDAKPGYYRVDDTERIVHGNYPRNAHSIEVRGNYLTAQTPYTGGINASLGYTNAHMIQPFYFGGLAGFTMYNPVAVGFPGGPFFSEALGLELPNPKFVGFDVNVPFGVAFKPIQNSGIEFFAEVQGGACLFSYYFDGYGRKGTYFGVTGGIYAGLGIDQATISFGTKYQGIMGAGGFTSLLSYTVGVAYRIRVGNTRR